ncbi:MAG: enoyl-CoA hydratase/isomerase family protein [Proteobacteria bacterium]|nr:enoyl-CoA hydratase/isomerase family protein [Pseudomonadota bacterium]
MDAPPVFETLICQLDGPVLTVTLNRPERLNAFSATMFFEVSHLADVIAGDPDVRVLVFQGAGRAFSSGADLADMSEGKTDVRQDDFQLRIMDAQSAFDRVEALPQPTIAALNGHAVGAGLQLSLACDFRIAARGIKVGLSDVKIGIIPALGATTRLQRLVGLAWAKEMIVAGDLISSDQAMEIGLLYQLVDPEDLDRTVKALCDKLLARAPLAMAAAKDLLNREAPLDQVAAAQARLFRSADALEGISSFLEKRPPRFKGS